MSPTKISSRKGLLTGSLINRWIAPLRANRPVLLSLLVFLSVGSLVIPLSMEYWLNEPQFLQEVLAEAHGMMMDLLLFGCLLLWLDQKAERERRVQRYRNAINDFLGWETEEAMYRSVGNIRRLNREGAVPDTLKHAYLKEADLKGADLSETTLHGANLSEADLQYADMSRAYLGNADFSGANLYKADLSGAHFGVFVGMTAPQDEKQSNLKGAYLRGVNLRGIRNATAQTFSEVETLYKARLDPDLEAEIEEQYPELLEPRASDWRT